MGRKRDVLTEAQRWASINGTTIQFTYDPDVGRWYARNGWVRQADANTIEEAWDKLQKGG